MSQLTEKCFLEEVVIKSCGHPNARQVEGNQLSDAICLDCLCQNIFSIYKNSLISEDSQAAISMSQRILPTLTANTAMVDNLAGFVQSTSNSKEEHLCVEALRSLLRVIDAYVREYLVHKFAQLMKCGMTFSAIICQEVILNDEKSKTIFLEKHGDVLEHLIFRIHDASLQNLPCMYRVLKVSCTQDIVSKTLQSKQSGKEGFDYLFPHTLKITTDIIRLLKTYDNSDFIFSCLDFLATFFENHFAVYITFHSDNAIPICSAFRKILFTNLPNLQKAVIRVLCVILLVSSSSISGQRSGQFQQLAETIPHTLVKVELDHHSISCFNTSDAELIISTLRFLHLLSTKEDFEYERVVPTLEACIRVFTSNLHLDELKASQTYDFFSVCLSKLKAVEYILQNMILTLCEKLVLAKNWTTGEGLNYFKLLLHCKDKRARDKLLQILDFSKHSDIPKTTLCSLKQFLLICHAILQCDMDSQICDTQGDLARHLLEYLIMDKQYLTLIFGLLRNTKLGDDMYVLTILHLIVHFRVDDVSIPSSNLPERIERVFEDNCENTFEVRVPHSSETWGWTSEIFFEISFLIRANASLIKNPDILSAWAQVMGCLLQHASKKYFPEGIQIFEEGKVGTCLNNDLSYWIEGLAHLPTDMLRWNWMDAIHTLGGGLGFYPKHYVILASYYAYYLFAPNARTDVFLTSDFFENLDRFILKFTTSLEISNQTCLYLKIAIFLISCVWFDPLTHPKMAVTTGRIVSNIGLIFTRHFEYINVERIVTFKWPVVALFTCIPSLPFPMFFNICEKWIRNCFQDFKNFLKMCHSSLTIRFKKDIWKRTLTTVLADGHKDVSCKILNIWKKNQLNCKNDILNFEEHLVYQTLFTLVSDIRRRLRSFEAEEDKDEMCVDSDEDDLTLENILLIRKVGNLSNFFHVVGSVSEGAVSEISFPYDFCPNILRIVRVYNNFEEIGRLGLEFVNSVLHDKTWKASMAVSILNDDMFLKFLEKTLNFANSLPEYCYVAYDIVTCLQEALNQKILSYSKSTTMEWSMTYFISYMKHSVTDVDYLKFLISLLVCDFQSDLVKVPEAEGTVIPPVLLRNLVFNLGNLLYQVIDDGKLKHVWNTLTEILKYLDRQTHCSPIPRESVNFLNNIIFSAPLLIMIETYLFMDKNLTAVQISVLEFLNMWTNLILASTNSESSLYVNLNQLPAALRPFRLENVFLRIRDLLYDYNTSLDTNILTEDFQREIEMNIISQQVEELLKIIKREVKLDDNETGSTFSRVRSSHYNTI